MRKFYIQSLKGKTSILEVEGELLLQSEDPTLIWGLKEGEYVFKIAKPASLAGERYMSFAFSETLEEATASAHKSIDGSVAMQLRKGQITAEQVAEQAETAKAAIEVVKLK